MKHESTVLNCQAFADGVMRELKVKGWNKFKLSRISGISPNTLTELTRGRREPSLSTIIRILDALEISLEQLMKGNNEILIESLEHNKIVVQSSAPAAGSYEFKFEPGYFHPSDDAYGHAIRTKG